MSVIPSKDASAKMVETLRMLDKEVVSLSVIRSELLMGVVSLSVMRSKVFKKLVSLSLLGPYVSTANKGEAG